MAEGGSSLSEGHDAIFDFNCSQCFGETETYVEAIAYCPECPSFFCGSCLKLHGRLLVTKPHKVLDETRKGEWDSAGNRGRGGRSDKECPTHAGEVIITFCVSHDALCCALCNTMDHSACKDKKPILEVAKGITQKAEYAQLQDDAEKLQTDIKKATTAKQSDQAGLNASREQVLGDIARFRDQILEAIGRLEERVRDDMEQAFEPKAEEVVANLATCAKLEKAVEHIIEGLKSTSNDETQSFIKMKLYQRQMKEYVNFVKTLAQPVQPRLTFVENAPLLQDINNASCFGEVETDSVYTNNPYSLTKAGVSKQHVKMPSDASTCYIDGLCQMPDGQIIVSDAVNKSVKRLDASYNVKDHCDVPDKPNAICAVGEKEIAVAMETKGLQFITVGDQLKKTKSLDIGHESFGVAYRDNQLFVSDKRKKVYVHAMSGALLRVIQRDGSGEDLFNHARHLAISANGARLYVAEREKGLMVLDRDGKLISVATSPKLGGARGVCLDTHGNVFLQCCLTSNIAQIDAMGESILGIVAEKKDGLFAPGAALFDVNKSALVVTSSPPKGADYLDVCPLEHV